MSVVRGLRLVSSIESNSITGACLETLLTDTGRRSDFGAILTLPGQTCVLTVSEPALRTIANSCTALTDVFYYNYPCDAIKNSNKALCYLLSACSAPIIGASNTYLGIALNNCCGYSYYLGANNPFWSSFSCTILTNTETRNYISNDHKYAWCISQTLPQCNSLWFDSWKFNTVCGVRFTSTVTNPGTCACFCVPCIGIDITNLSYIQCGKRGYSQSVSNLQIISASSDCNCNCVTGTGGYCIFSNNYTQIYCSVGDMAAGYVNDCVYLSLMCIMGCGQYTGANGPTSITCTCARFTTSSNTAMSFNMYVNYCIAAAGGGGCVCGYLRPQFHNVTNNCISPPICGACVKGCGGVTNLWCTDSSGYPNICGVSCGAWVCCGGVTTYSNQDLLSFLPCCGYYNYYRSDTLYTCFSPRYGINCCCVVASNVDYIPNYNNFYAYSHAYIAGSSPISTCWANVPTVSCYNPSTCCAITCVSDLNSIFVVCGGVVCGGYTYTYLNYASCYGGFKCLSSGVLAINFGLYSPQYVVGIKDAWCAMWMPSTFGSTWVCGSCGCGIYPSCGGACVCGLPIRMEGATKCFIKGYSLNFCGSGMCGTCGCFGQVRCIYSIPNTPVWLITATCGADIYTGCILYRTTDMTTLCCVCYFADVPSCASQGLFNSFVSHCSGRTIAYSPNCGCVMYTTDCGCTWTKYTNICICACCHAFNPSAGANGTIMLYGYNCAVWSCDANNWYCTSLTGCKGTQVYFPIGDFFQSVSPISSCCGCVFSSI